MFETYSKIVAQNKAVKLMSKSVYAFKL